MSVEIRHHLGLLFLRTPFIIRGEMYCGKRVDKM